MRELRQNCWTRKLLSNLIFAIESLHPTKKIIILMSFFQVIFPLLQQCANNFERSHLFHKKLSNYNFIWLRNNDCMKNNFYEPMLSGLLIVGSLRTHLFALFDHFLWLIFVSFFCWCYGKREKWIILLSYNSKKQRKNLHFDDMKLGWWVQFSITMNELENSRATREFLWWNVLCVTFIWNWKATQKMPHTLIKRH